MPQGRYITQSGGLMSGTKIEVRDAEILRRNNTMKQLLKNLMNDESGQDLIEYALIAALIALVAITGLNGLAGSINSEFTKIGGDL
jgi:pilus assembly protein Flp/PilA